MATVAVIGAGNIGTVLCDALAREPAISRLIVVDPDSYKAENLRGQTITTSDVGRPKAFAQAAKLSSICPELMVAPIVGRVEEVPLGTFLACDVICSCLDSLAARIAVNQIAWRLGKPWVDAGVRSENLLARAEVFLPSPSAPCIECALSDDQYAMVEQRNFCHTAHAATNAPAWLGAHAASMQAAECVRLLEHLAGGSRAVEPVQVIHDIGNRRQFVNRNHRNEHCRFDHRIFSPIEPTSESMRVLFSRGSAFDEEAVLTAYGKTFAVGGNCLQCGGEFPGVLAIEDQGLLAVDCPNCHRQTAIHPANLRSRLLARDIPEALFQRSPQALGLPQDSIFTMTQAGSERHYLLERNTNGQYL